MLHHRSIIRTFYCIECKKKSFRDKRKNTEQSISSLLGIFIMLLFTQDR